MGGDCKQSPPADANRGLLLLLLEPQFPVEPQNLTGAAETFATCSHRVGKLCQQRSDGRLITVTVLNVLKSWNCICSVNFFTNSDSAQSEYNKVNRGIWSVLTKLRKVGLTMSSVYIVLSVYVLCACSPSVSSK